MSIKSNYYFDGKNDVVKLYLYKYTQFYAYKQLKVIPIKSFIIIGICALYDGSKNP